MALLDRIYDHTNSFFDEQKQSLYHRIPDTVSAAQRQTLADAGLMPNQFMQWPHDAVVSELQALAHRVDLRCAADAFVASMRPDCIGWQAVLPAAAFGLALPAHADEPFSDESATCRVCGHEAQAHVDVTQQRYFNGLEGSGWGEYGPADALLTLQWALAQPQWPEPAPRDAWVFHQVMHTLRSLPPAARYSKARDALKARKLLTGQRPSRYGSLLEALSFMGLLANPVCPGMFTQFTTFAQRDQRPNDRCEVPGPLAWWSAADGVDEALLARLFGHINAPAHEPPAPKQARKTVARAPRVALKTVPGPLQAGDVYALRLREDRWGAAYCHQMRTDANGVVRGLMEYLDYLHPQPPSAEQVQGLPFRNRLNGNAWQSWCRGLDKTTGVKRVAAGVVPIPNTVKANGPVIGSAKDLLHMAGWHFEELA